METAIKVLRQAGYYSHALYLAENHAHHEWYLKIQLEDIKVSETLDPDRDLFFFQDIPGMMKVLPGGKAGACAYSALTSPQNYQEALRYIGKLPFEQAESNMKRYGKILMHHIPEQTTQLLKGLCTDYQPSLEGRGDREAPGCRVRRQGEWLLDNRDHFRGLMDTTPTHSASSLLPCHPRPTQRSSSPSLPTTLES